MIKYIIGLVFFLGIQANLQAQNEPLPPHNAPDSEARRPTVEQLFAHMDSNKDNRLSKKEIKGPLVHHFDQVDANKDGFLTRQELKAAPKPPRREGHPPRPQDDQGAASPTR